MDADTIIDPDSLDRLAACASNYSLIIAVCGSVHTAERLGLQQAARTLAGADLLPYCIKWKRSVGWVIPLRMSEFIELSDARRPNSPCATASTISPSTTAAAAAAASYDRGTAYARHGHGYREHGRRERARVRHDGSYAPLRLRRTAVIHHLAPGALPGDGDGDGASWRRPGEFVWHSDL